MEALSAVSYYPIPIALLLLKNSFKASSVTPLQMLFDHIYKGQCVHDQQGLLNDVWSNEGRLSRAKRSLNCDVTGKMRAAPLASRAVLTATLLTQMGVPASLQTR